MERCGCFFVACLQEPCPQLRHSMPQQLLHRSLTLCSEPLGKVLWTIDFGCLCWNSSIGGGLPNLKQKIRGKSAVAFCSTDGWIPWDLFCDERSHRAPKRQYQWYPQCWHTCDKTCFPLLLQSSWGTGWTLSLEQIDTSE